MAQIERQSEEIYEGDIYICHELKERSSQMIIIAKKKKKNEREKGKGK